MDSSKREALRKELLARVMADPEGVVDLVLSLMDQVETLTKRVEQLEDQLKKTAATAPNHRAQIWVLRLSRKIAACVARARRSRAVRKDTRGAP